MPSDTLTVGELLSQVQRALERGLPGTVWVEGEVASLKRQASGHVYFQLVEAAARPGPPAATIDVALFDSARQEVNALLRRTRAVRMTDGVHLRIAGRVDVYPPQGRLRLVMSSIDPEYTLGRLAAERERVLRALADEGLLDRNRLLPFPMLPLRIGLVTSDGSAALADFLHELETSPFAWRVLFADAPMQGGTADRAIAAALERLATEGVDLIALVRGGGARTDLLAFDSELLARSIASLPVPVLTGIGHEIDSSVADAVAARSCKTPTACAAEIVEAATMAADRVERVWSSLSMRSRSLVRSTKLDLDHRAHRLAAAARHASRAAETRVSMATDRLGPAARRSIGAATRRGDALEARAAALDPARALARGWSITRDASGRIVRDPAELHDGDDLLTTVHGGDVRSRVVGRREARSVEAAT